MQRRAEHVVEFPDEPAKAQKKAGSAKARKKKQHQQQKQAQVP